MIERDDKIPALEVLVEELNIARKIATKYTACKPISMRLPEHVTMSNLTQLQNDFQAYLLDASKGAAFTKQIVNDKKVGVKKRLGHLLRCLSAAYY